ncbi:MAG: hypothetical protein KDB37_18350 [Ilumatobacter sp.]|nr:hypothetical protein [Ilumatobacter sp.]
MRPEVLDQVRALYGASPDGFVAARNLLVKELKRSDEREDAAIVAALRRPGWVDVALDRVAVSGSPEVGAFVDAAEAARRIQDDAAAGRRSGSLPDALRTVRAAMSGLASVADRELVGLGRASDLAAITARLGQVAGDPELVGLLAAGVLGVDQPDLVPAFVDTSVRPAPAEQDDTAEQHDRAEREAARALRAAEREADVAATAARRAAERRERAAAAVDAAAETVRAANEALDRARAELADHAAQADEAERLAAEAAARLADLT